MKKILFLSAILAYQHHCDSAHAAVKAVAFEVASIAPSKPGSPGPPEDPAMVRLIYPGGRFTAKAVRVKFLFEWAYGIIPEQHSGGPSWIEDERYDIVAKAESPSATDAEIRQMVRTLLAERFQLKFHIEKREMGVLILSLGKSEPRVTRPKEGETFALKMIPTLGTDQKVASWHVVATCYSFERLNETFARQLGRVIVNQTGLTGDFDFALDFTPDEERPNPLDPAFIIKAMRDQLGFNVKSQKGEADFYVIESAEKVQAGN